MFKRIKTIYIIELALDCYTDNISIKQFVYQLNHAEMRELRHRYNAMIH